MPTDGDGPMSEEKRLLQWGGLAGVLSPIFTLLTAITLFGFVPPAPADLAGPVARYPDVRAAVAVGETFYLVSAILSVAFYLALYRVLRGASLAPALWGTGLSLLGLAVVAVEAVPRVAFSAISDLYHAPGATPEDQATLALIWRTTQGMFNQLDTAAVIFLSAGYILLGIAMVRNPTFGRRLGGVTVVLALAALVGLYLLGITSLLYAPLALAVLIILPLGLGWKVYALSKA